MGKKFYIVIFCLIFCSVLLLGMSYSKNSNDSVDTGLIENSNDSFRAVYSSDKNLDTEDNNTLRVSLINKKNSNADYALYLKEMYNNDYQDVYYSIDGGEEYLLTDGVIYLGTLNKYGSNGDVLVFDITIRSVNKYSFYFSIAEYNLFDEVSYGS